MKYEISSENIPQGKREEINNKILLLIESGQAKQLPSAAIFNGYTGHGGLHGLDYQDFDSYSEFSSAKKEIENGQFFTPPTLAQRIVDSIQVRITDLVADITCGKGTFYNFLPVEANCYGCELDPNAVKVARYLFPTANIEFQDIRYYKPEIQFDLILGNPPFGLEWKADGKSYISQGYFMKKAFELLAPGGILAMVAPLSFLQDDFMAKYMIQDVNGWFGFLTQAIIPNNAFAGLGVKNYSTKVMYFQKRFEGIPARDYKTDEYVMFDPEAIKSEIIIPSLQHKANHASEIKLSQAVGQNDWSFKNPALRKAKGYEFRLKKFLFEIKSHPELKSKLGKALAYIKRFETEVKPDAMKFEEWEKVRLTQEKVIAYLRRAVRGQGKKRKEGYSIFNDRFGICIKSHDAGTSKLFSDKGISDISWLEIISEPNVLSNHILKNELSRFKELARRKTLHFNRNIVSFDQTTEDEVLNSFVENFTFIKPEGDIGVLNDIQKKDLQAILSHDYGILNWQQGSGKTVASWCAAKFRLQTNRIKNVFIVAPPIAIEATWIPFLKRNNANFTIIKSILDCRDIQKGQIVVCATTTLSKVKRFLPIHLKKISNNAFLVFDESDEITNYQSKRSRVVRDVFRKLKYKLLTTGTTTRNNIGELYGQLELMYNNSNLFVCDCPMVFREQTYKDHNGTLHKEIVMETNDHYGKPFSPRGGSQLFKNCFAPAKSTVFGIQKHNQDIYNSEALEKLIKRSVITRKFREIAGDGRFEIHTHKLISKPFEQALYDRILEELNSILPSYYSSTGNSRKDAMLRIVRQLQLLIKSCSIPHLMESTDELPAKAGYIKNMVKEFHGEKIIVGATSVKASMFYSDFLRSQVGHERDVFFVSGKTHSVSARQKVVDTFQQTQNAILVCTEQSLSSSINIPACSRVILESLQWNIPKMEQFYFRTIRFDSIRKSNIHFVLYQNSIEVNLMALLTAKERMNDFIKTLELRDHDEVMEDFGLDESFLDFLLEKITDEDGKMKVRWGKQQITA